MKKVIFVLLSLISVNVFAYFDGGINYVNGNHSYSGQDIYVLIGSNNMWVKGEYSKYNRSGIDSMNKFSARVGFEKELYTLSLVGSYIPEKNNYKATSLGADITFSLNPTSSNRKRLAGPNYGFVSRSAKGVTQIDLGAAVNYTIHENTGFKDLKQTDLSLFAGAKIMLVQASVNYTFSSYDDNNISKTSSPLMLKVTGMNSYISAYPENSFNLRIDLTGYPMITPFASYTKTSFKSTSENMDSYTVGAYIDLNMITAVCGYETYKFAGKTNNFLTFSAGIRF